MHKCIKFCIIILAISSHGAQAVPCDLMTTFSAANPIASKRGAWSQLLARGSGTNDMYVMEIDPANCALPVSIVAGSLTLGYDTNYGTVGAATLRTASQIGNATGAASFGNGAVSAQTLRTVSILSDGTDIASISAGGALLVDIGGSPVTVSNFPTTVDVNYGTPGSSTIRTASMLGVGSTAVSNANPVPISDAGGSITIDGSVNVTNLPTTVNTDYGTPGASTIRVASMLGIGSTVVSTTNPVPISNAAINSTYGTAVNSLRTASQIGNTTGAADFNAGAIGAQTLRVAAIPANATAIADFNYGTGGAQTQRVAAMLGVGSTAVSSSNPVPVTSSGSGRAYVDSSFLSYSSTNVTSGAWVQIDSSTAGAFSALTVFSGCAAVLELGTGAAAAETRVALIPPGGIDGQFQLTIASGTRLSLRSVSGETCSTGTMALTGFN